MTALTQTARSLDPATAADGVFDTILADIVRGAYPPKSRLPAERELARLLGASRPTVREALSRLAEWNLLETRRGSGIVVREQREWCIEVLPAVLRYGADLKPGVVGQMVRDLLSVRRAMILDVLALVADRIDPAQLDAPREAVRRAWEVRADGARFAEQDFSVMRGVVEAADFYPGVWLLNRMAGVYLDIARSMGGAIAPPDDYVEAHERFLDALAAGDVDRAVRLETEYLETNDERLLAMMGVP